MATAIFDYTANAGTNGQRGRSTAVNALKFTIASSKVIKYYIIQMLRYHTGSYARVCLYTHNSGTDLPDTIIADSTVLKAESAMTESFVQYQLDIASPPTLEAGTYWMVMDDNADTSAYVLSGLNTTAGNDGVRKIYAGTASTLYKWGWGLWADEPAGGTVLPVFLNLQRQFRN